MTRKINVGSEVLRRASATTLVALGMTIASAVNAAAQTGDPASAVHRAQVIGQPISDYAMLATAVTSVTPSGCHIAVIDDSGVFDPNKRLIMDGTPIEGFVPIEVPVFSPDGHHMAFVANTERVVVDGKAMPRFGKVAFRSLVFGGSGNHLGYPILSDKNKVQMVLDGRLGPEFDEIIGDPVFSDDGNHVAYRARTPAGWVVVHDGFKGDAYKNMSRPVFSHDGKHIAYIATKDNKTSIIFDGKATSDAYLDQPVASLVFSPNGTRLAYRGPRPNNQWSIFVDDKPGPDFSSDMFPEDIVFSPDSTRLAYTVRSKDQGVFIVLDGQVVALGKNFLLGTGVPTFSADSKRVLLRLVSRVFLDGQLGPEFHELHTAAVFSPDGKHVAYGASEGPKGGHQRYCCRSGRSSCTWVF